MTRLLTIDICGFMRSKFARLPCALMGQASCSGTASLFLAVTELAHPFILYCSFLYWSFHFNLLLKTLFICLFFCSGTGFSCQGWTVSIIFFFSYQSFHLHRFSDKPLLVTLQFYLSYLLSAMVWQSGGATVGTHGGFCKWWSHGPKVAIP